MKLIYELKKNILKYPCKFAIEMFKTVKFTGIVIFLLLENSLLSSSRFVGLFFKIETESKIVALT